MGNHDASLLLDRVDPVSRRVAVHGAVQVGQRDERPVLNADYVVADGLRGRHLLALVVQVDVGHHRDVTVVLVFHHLPLGRGVVLRVRLFPRGVCFLAGGSLPGGLLHGGALGAGAGGGDGEGVQFRVCVSAARVDPVVRGGGLEPLLLRKGFVPLVPVQQVGRRFLTPGLVILPLALSGGEGEVRRLLLLLLLLGPPVLLYELSLLLQHGFLLLLHQLEVVGVLLEEVLPHGRHVPLQQEEQLLLRGAVHLLLQVLHEHLLRDVPQQEVLHQTLHQHVRGSALLLREGNEHEQKPLHLSHVLDVCVPGCAGYRPVGAEGGGGGRGGLGEERVVALVVVHVGGVEVHVQL